MFLNGSGGYRESDNVAYHRGDFLVLCQRDRDYAIDIDHANWSADLGEIRALVRHVHMSQLGHWMMGTLRMGAYRIGLSGSYGSDGLPTTVPQYIYDQAMPVPAELMERWNTGGGHNSAGSEASFMRAWAREHWAALKTPKQVTVPDFFSNFHTREITFETAHKDYVAWRHINLDGVASVAIQLQMDYELMWQGIAGFKFNRIIRYSSDKAQFSPRVLLRVDALHMLLEHRLREAGWMVADSRYFPPKELGWQWLAEYQPEFQAKLQNVGYQYDCRKGWFRDTVGA